jgi:hypothetical protein
VNCQRSSYWITRIEAMGFRCNVATSREGRIVSLRDLAQVNHFARSGLIFERVNRSPASANQNGTLERLLSTLRANLLARRIRWGFRLSADYGDHRARRRAAKRQRIRASKG